MIHAPRIPELMQGLRLPQALADAGHGDQAVGGDEQRQTERRAAEKKSEGTAEPACRDDKAQHVGESAAHHAMKWKRLGSSGSSASAAP